MKVQAAIVVCRHWCHKRFLIKFFFLNNGQAAIRRAFLYRNRSCYFRCHDFNPIVLRTAKTPNRVLAFECNKVKDIYDTLKTLEPLYNSSHYNTTTDIL